jgi:hypothetical protein
MGALIFYHETKPSFIVTLGLNQSKEGIQVQVDQFHGNLLALLELSQSFTEERRIQTML